MHTNDDVGSCVECN